MVGVGTLTAVSFVGPLSENTTPRACAGSATSPSKHISDDIVWTFEKSKESVLTGTDVTNRDEIEKGFAGSSSGTSDSGTSARVLGSFLTWMQEKTAPVFVVATANDVSSLPPEFLRKGRFDEIFSVDLPSHSERKEIFDIVIRGTTPSRGHLLDNKSINLDTLAEATKGYSGAEIRAAVEEAMVSAFDAGKDLNLLDLMDSVKGSRPLSETMKEKIDKLRAWCGDRARPANAKDPMSETRPMGRMMDN